MSSKQTVALAIALFLLVVTTLLLVNSQTEKVAVLTTDARYPPQSLVFVGQQVETSNQGYNYQVPVAKKTVIGYLNETPLILTGIKSGNTYTLTIQEGKLKVGGNVTIQTTPPPPSGTVTVVTPKLITVGEYTLLGLENPGTSYSSSVGGYEYQVRIIDGYVVGTIGQRVFRVPAIANQRLDPTIFYEYLDK